MVISWTSRYFNSLHKKFYFTFSYYSISFQINDPYLIFVRNARNAVSVNLLAEFKKIPEKLENYCFWQICRKFTHFPSVNFHDSKCVRVKKWQIWGMSAQSLWGKVFKFVSDGRHTLWYWPSEIKSQAALLYKILKIWDYEIRNKLKRVLPVCIRNHSAHQDFFCCCIICCHVALKDRLVQRGLFCFNKKYHLRWR